MRFLTRLKKIRHIRLIQSGLLILMAILSSHIMAHSEHGKARFVSIDGTDTGYCENALRPCKSISFAVQRSNKGDKVLIASGTYTISNAEELFYLKSEIVPVLAGFNRFDHFQSQSPDVNPTFLTGVPDEMVDALRLKGFKIINDGKSFLASANLTHKMAAFKALNEVQTEVNCVNGQAGSFPCSKIDLVAHIPLSSFSTRPNAGNDVWGHVDLNSGKEYAIIGLQNGAAVVDLSQPENPVEVGTIGGSGSIWRDIKVYQYFDQATTSWKAYAYVTIDSASDGVTIIDLNHLPESVSLVERNKSVSNAHNVYISNIDHSLNIKLEDAEPLLQLIGANRSSGSFNSYSLANPATIAIKNNQGSFNGYTHDGASVLLDDSRKDTDCFNATINCTVFVDFNEKEMVLWDITNPDDTRKLSETRYSDVASANQYVHSGWVTEDKRFVLLHDEFDEYKGGLNSTVRIFKIDSLLSPVQVGQWTGPTKAIDHNGFVRGNRYYMSNYERGLTILDITDPANPVEAGYFDTFPSSNNASFNGAWGVYPYLPSGLILVSDINSGLYILRDNTQSATQGSVSFDTDLLQVESGSDAIVSVSRNNAISSSTSTSVKYEIYSGSATKIDDFTPVSGTLDWIGNDASSKTFNIPTSFNASDEFWETLYVRLFDPTSGMTLTNPSYITVKISGLPITGAVEFAQESLQVAENSGTVSINVHRNSGQEGAVSVNYRLVDGTAIAGEDFLDISGTLIWDDGDRSVKTLEINLIDDIASESDESFTIELTDVTGAILGTYNQTTVTIKDDESNSAPTVELGESFQVNSGQLVELSSTVADVDNDELTYLWQQVNGISVALNNSDQAQASFVAPAAEGVLEFRLTVTDSKAAQSSDFVLITVVAPAGSSSSGGGALGGLILLLGAGLLLFRRKYIG